MKKHGWTIPVALALIVWAGIGMGVAQALPISRIGGGGTVTLSIFRQTSPGVFEDVTDTYLPEWAPGAPLQVVYIVVNGSTTTPVLFEVSSPPSVPSGGSSSNPFLTPTPTTSHYPGNCTNFGTDPGPDFTLGTTKAQGTVTVLTSSGNKTGYPLTSQDCGGMAVIQVGSDKFIVPRDTNLNGIPDFWEATFCPGNSCPTGKEDNDTSPGSSISGDGISAFDEYRGFIASGVHIRTDPRQKDLFVHLVNPQCVGPLPSGDPTSFFLGSTTSLLGGGAITFVSGSPLFANVTTLISDTQVHFIGYQPNHTNYKTPEWVDRFHHYSVADGLVFVPTTGTGTTTTPPADDRWVTTNRLYNQDASAHTLLAQKGLRVIECVDQNTVPPVPISPLGVAALGSPNGPDNSIIYTQRIVTYLAGTLAATCPPSTPACLFYSTFQSGAWTSPTAMSPNDIISRAIEYYLAMEIGHTVQLTPAQEGTRQSPTLYGYHHAPGSGSNLDQALTNSVTTTGNTFYIPSLYNTSDLQNYALK